MAKKPKTPVKLSKTEPYRAVVRYLHLHKTIDRLGLGFVLGQPFGSVSRVISTLCNEGYLERNPPRMVYSRAFMNYEVFCVDTDDKGHHLNWNYGTSPQGRATVYQKTDRWGQFMRRYDRFLKTGKDPGRNYRG